jgi:hypothetical protein
MFFANLFLQLLFTVGLISGVGMLVWLLNRAFYKLIGTKNRAVCVATGFIGTPIHEIGHAFFCIVFLHKIREIKLYRVNPSDGVLGYVNHAYKKKNLYQQIGNFFIGVGPILFGSLILALLMRICVPALFNNITRRVEVLSATDSFSSVVEFTFATFWRVIVNFFTTAKVTSFPWWLFMLLASSIAIHMTLSTLDVKGSYVGLGLLVATLTVLDIILYLLGPATLWGFTQLCLSFAFLTLSFFVISITVCLILVLLAGLVKCVAFCIKH